MRRSGCRDLLLMSSGVERSGGLCRSSIRRPEVGGLGRGIEAVELCVLFLGVGRSSWRAFRPRDGVNRWWFRGLVGGI